MPFQSRRFYSAVGAQSDSGRIFQAEHLAVGVIGEGLAIAGPTDDGPQALLSGFCRHVVFELVEKPAPGRLMARTLIENAADVCGQRNVAQKVALERRLRSERSDRETLALPQRRRERERGERRSPFRPDL